MDTLDDNLETISLFNDIKGESNENIRPCDYRSRVWCMRMCSLFFIIIMLIVMILKTFEYYSQMLKDMDDLIDARPFVISLFDNCNKQQYNLVKINNHDFSISYIPEQMSSIIIHTIPYMNYTYNDNIIHFEELKTCFNIIVWGIV